MTRQKYSLLQVGIRYEELPQPSLEGGQPPLDSWGEEVGLDPAEKHLQVEQRIPGRHRS